MSKSIQKVQKIFNLREWPRRFCHPFWPLCNASFFTPEDSTIAVSEAAILHLSAAGHQLTPTLQPRRHGLYCQKSTHSMMSWNLTSKKFPTETEYEVWKLLSCSFTYQSKKIRFRSPFEKNHKTLFQEVNLLHKLQYLTNKKKMIKFVPHTHIA